MHQVTIEKIVPFSAKEMFDLVMDVESYPQFLPWCDKGKIIENNDNKVIADLDISFKTIRKKYTSKITINHISKNEYEVFVRAVEGPFKKLETYWHFKDVNHKESKIYFDIDFEFNSKLLSSMLNFIFKKAKMKMIESFEERAFEIYNRS
ncbi:type II toxin-antitoxin system RatA family toxin [Rickettsiales bacterium]|nr:type II toxin-antitoxin system RatA family toxin [Rickettsiales bacterium]